MEKNSVFSSARQRDRVYEILLDALGCGPSDGGCLAFARALQAVRGGQVHVILGSVDGHHVAGQHAIVRLADGRWADARGEGDLPEVVDRFVAREVTAYGQSFELADVRPWQEGDMPRTRSPEPLVAALIQALQQRPPRARTARW